MVHAHLKDILEHLKTEWHMQEPVSTMIGIKHSQEQRLLIKVDAPEAVLSV